MRKKEKRSKVEPTIIFEDQDLLVIDKPSGMIANEAESVKVDTVQSWFMHKYKIVKDATEFGQKGGIVHRLDKDTSGVMVLAKNLQAYQKLKQQFLERKVIKKYLALVHGALKEDKGLISLPIERHPGDRHKFTIGTDLSRVAITEWQVTQKFPDFTLLDLTPHTGRTHQLRVHLQSLHHPIVADPIYGFKKTWEEDLKWCPRLFLHAKYLEFTHPVSNQKVSFEAKLPGDLHQALESLLH